MDNRKRPSFKGEMKLSLKVSVVVPTYNRVRQLKNLLKSFSKIKGKKPREIIIVDDCSTDTTQMVAKEWSSLRLVWSIPIGYNAFMRN